MNGFSWLGKAITAVEESLTFYAQAGAKRIEQT